MPTTALALVSRDQVLTDPVGHASAGARHAMWCVDPSLTGVSLWGRLTRSDLEELLAPLALPHHPALRLPCDTVLDGSRVEGLAPEAFDALLRLGLQHQSAIRQRTRRQALVRPAGLPGAVFAGFNELLAVGYEWRVFSSLHQALVWLDRPDADAIRDEVNRIVESARHPSPLIGGLTAWLRTQGGRPTVQHAARALGVSARSLQRHLAEHKTGFRRLLDEVSLERAQGLLVETDLKVEAIAAQAGFSSMGTFIKSFRRYTGSTPGEWRRERG